MTYTINPAADYGPDEPFFGYRHFWAASYEGAYAADYDAGFQMGETDLENGTSANLDTLAAVDINSRDLAWNAKVDGYTFATRDRGLNKLRH